MASAVYEGVAGGGDLFQGQKFFIVQKVPLRNTLIEDVKVNMPLSRMAAAANFIKRNGGLVVPQEKNADVLIADHAKPKYAPANSVSWKYLEQSMKKGRLEDLEAHRIGSSGKTGLSGGLNPPKKLTRTPFTHEDDMALSIWVTKAERLGLYVGGYEIYHQFAEKVYFRVRLGCCQAKRFVESSAYLSVVACPLGKASLFPASARDRYGQYRLASEKQGRPATPGHSTCNSVRKRRNYTQCFRCKKTSCGAACHPSLTRG